jgi:hypothetical protein
MKRRLLTIALTGLMVASVQARDWVTINPANLHFCPADEMAQNEVWNNAEYDHKPIVACKRILNGHLDVCLPWGCVTVGKGK